jgi:hypothetical protein
MDLEAYRKLLRHSSCGEDIAEFFVHHAVPVAVLIGCAPASSEFSVNACRRDVTGDSFYCLLWTRNSESTLRQLLDALGIPFAWLWSTGGAHGVDAELRLPLREWPILHFFARCSAPFGD